MHTKRRRGCISDRSHKEGVPGLSNEMALLAISLLLASCCSLCSCAVQRSSPEAGVGGLLALRRYEYSYSSVATVYQHTNISLQAKVSLQLLSGQSSRSENELLLDVSNMSVTWSTPQGHVPDNSPIGDLSNWFSLVKEGMGGGIIRVYYPSDEGVAVVAFKKSLSQLISVGGVVERGVEEGGVNVVREKSSREHQQRRIVMEKELRFDEMAVLVSAESRESLTQESKTGDNSEDVFALFSHPLSSHSRLVLTGSEVAREVERPRELVIDSVAVSQVQEMLPISELSPLISEILQTCESAECAHRLSGALRHLVSADVSTLLGDLQQLPASKQLVLLDGLVQSGRGGDDLRVWLSPDKEEELVKRVLLYLATGKIQPTQAYVDATLDLLSSPVATERGGVSASLQHAVLLSLGGMAGLLTQQNPDLTNQITDVLSSVLNHVTGGVSSSRLRRSSASIEEDPLLQAILLDSMGNSKSPSLLPLLVGHVTGEGSLATKHAAVKAIGRYRSLESAEALLDAAETSQYPSVRHVAAKAYSTHPRAMRDVSHLLSLSPHHRSRRQIENANSVVLNVSMPTVNWNREFGETNISVDLGRTVRNSFDVDADAHSSRYTFSVYDESTFDANLLLSGGQQHTQMWGAEICLQGTATYDINILQGFSHNLTAYHHERLTAVVDMLTEAFSDAYTQITDSENAYSAAVSSLLQATDSVPFRFDPILDSLDRYQTESAALGTSQLKEAADEVFHLLNVTYSAGNDIITSSLPDIRQALDSLYPDKPRDFSNSLLVDSLPFTESRFLVRYLPSAPQQAMAGIYNVYRSSAVAFESLSSSYEGVRELLEPEGMNSQWLSPLVYLREASTQVTVLLGRIEATLDSADLLELSDDEVADLQLLREAVTSNLQATFDLAQEVGQEVIAAAEELERAFAGSREGFDAFTRAYENSRQQIDSIFGQKFHPDFPRLLQPCDMSGCGHYPATYGGVFNEGIDLQVSPASDSVVSPLSGYAHTFNSSLLPVSVQNLYSSSNYSGMGIILRPAEPSHLGVYVILSNLVPESGIDQEGMFVTAGDIVGQFPANSPQILHVEIIKEIDGVGYRLDPTSYLQPRLEPNVAVELECNDVVTYVGGVVVERRSLVTSSIAQEFIGSPLVVDVPNHEFPQPYDLVVMETGGAQPPGQVTFLQDSTFLMVGQIPVQLDFSIVGTYQLNYSQTAQFLSKTLDLSVTPSFLARVQGSVRVGSTVFATVDLEGTMLETSLPLVLGQDAASWPMTASSSMDVILVPSALNLTSRLFRLTAGGSAEPELLQTAVEWAYSIPPLNRDEFYYRGLLADDTPPVYFPLGVGAGEGDCFVRQLPGRAHANPAFEVLYSVNDRESLLNVTLGVGTYEYSDDILPVMELGGSGAMTVYDRLVPARRLFFTVTAENQNSLTSFATCSLVDEHFYDRSPPLGRINPIGQVTSHPSMIQALVVLFDEVGLTEIQEVAIGRLRGVAGSDVLPWTPFLTSLITTPPSDGGDVLTLYSFARAGRLVTDILQVTSRVSNASSCAYICEDQQNCLSFDYSLAQQNCILHDNIEGPPSQSFENIFSTPELQSAEGYEHFERLGSGNSTVVEFSGLELEHNVMYYINMRLRNRLGYESVVSSSGFLVDLTPPLPVLIVASNSSTESVFPGGCLAADVPLPGCLDPVVPRSIDRLYVDDAGSAVVFNGPVPLTDARFTSNTNTLSAHWNPFFDPESDIFSYTWCIGTSIGSCDILPHTDPHLQLGLTSPDSWTYSGVLTGQDLPEGNYYITIRATNGIAYGGPLFTTVQHSTPYKVDTTPPVISSAVDVSYNSSTNQLSVRYEASDTSGGVVRVEVALGRTPLDTAVLSWTVLADQSDTGMGYSVADTDIPDGLPVWLKLRATDAAGLQSVLAAESAFTIDHTPPIRGRVYDGDTLGSDAQYQDSSAPLCVNWVGFSDPHTGLGRILWTVRRAAGLVDSRNLTDEERARGVACYEGLSLSHNTTYYSSLTVYNGAGDPMSVTDTSNGIHVDMTAPLPGSVYDGSIPGTDMAFSRSFTTIHTSWSGFQDYESGIAQYRVNVFRQAVGDSVLSNIYQGAVNGDENQITINELRLENGDYVLVEVTSVNGAGGRVSVNTSGVIVDLTPPKLVSAVDGNNSVTDVQYQACNDTLAVVWDAADLESGISRILVNVYELREGRRVQVYPETETATGEAIPANRTSWTLGGLELNSGSRYVTSLTFINGAGLEIMHETSGITVDLTPPTIVSVSVSSDSYLDSDDTGDMVTMVADPNQTEARWMGFDLESGIQHFLVGVVDENDTLVTPGYTMFGGTVLGGLIQTSDLPPDSQYRVAVIATNEAGTQSEIAFSAPYGVTAGDRAGVVLDGGGAEMRDYDYTDEVTAVTARFYGFSSQTCGGVAAYQWAVGEGSGELERESVLQFISAGVTDNGDGSGHAQLPVAGLRALIGRRLYITVRGVTGCGGVLESTSNGFVIDTTPPSLEILATGQLAIERAQSEDADIEHEPYQTSDVYSSIWRAMDSESGIPDDVMVQVGTFPGGADLSPMGVVPGDSIRGRVSAPEGVPTYVTVVAANGAGLESMAISEPITMDTTPPLTGQMSCTASGYPVPLSQWDPSPLNNSGVFSCQWRGVVDPESGIHQYAVAIGTSATDQSVMSKTVLDGDSSLSVFTSPPISSIDHTLPYYVILFSTNGANLEAITISNPVYFENSPPIISGEVFVYPNFKVANYVMSFLSNLTMGAESARCLLDTDVISIMFSEAEDLESGDEDFSYEIGIGLRPGSDDVMYYESFSPVSLGISDSPSLYHRLHPLDFSSAGRRGVYFNVRVGNNVGRYTTLVSDMVFIKSNLTMERDWIYDGFDSGSDVEYQSSTVEIQSSFFFGVNCPIRRGQWAVESVDGNLTQPYVDLVPFRYQNPFHANTFHVVTDQVQLYNDETYRVLVQATDYSGEVHVLRSNGVTVTTLGLIPGLVRDGPIPEQDLNYQESITSLSACWTPFGNGSPEQEIAYYEVSAGSDLEHTSTRSNIAPFTNVGLNRTHTFTDLQLQAEVVRYFISVRAYAVSGMFVEANSNGIVVGFGHSIIPGLITLPRFQANGATLSAYWSDFESSLPIRQYEWALGSAYLDSDQLEGFCSDTNSNFSKFFDVSGFANIGLDTYISVQGLELRDNTTYYLTLRVLDQAKRCIAISSPSGVTVDQTPPISQATPTAVVLGPVESRKSDGDFVIYVQPGMELSIEWEEFEDAESGVDYYQVGLFQQVSCGNNSLLGEAVVDYIIAGDASDPRRIPLTNVPLEVGVSYVGVVGAINRAGVVGYGYSQPILLDDLIPTPGVVKDGEEWNRDVTYQSDLSMLSAVFTHAKLPLPDALEVPVTEPCPPARTFTLSEWSPISTPAQLIGYASSAIIYSDGQVTVSGDPPKISIATFRDATSTEEEVMSGAYQTFVDISNGGRFQADILAATGADFQMNIVTSVLFIDSGAISNVLAKFEPEAADFSFGDSPSFSAFGFQIYREFVNNTVSLPQRVVLWTTDRDTLSQPVYVRRDIHNIDLDSVNSYRVEFDIEQLDTGYTRAAHLYINDILMVSLYGLPALSNTTRAIFHTFNRQGYVPPRIPNLSVEAVFANVTLPSQTGHLCDYGTPFYSGRSPMVEFRAWAGTRVGLDDVQEAMVVSNPCLPCLPGPCEIYSCNVTCTTVDPYTISLTFPNLTLSPGYPTPGNQSLSSEWYQPATYYVTVEAITASGRRVTSSSNGVTIDTTPPILTSPILHFDVSFSTEEPVLFQGSNNTISAQWSFQDEQSGITDYIWAIGTIPFGTDIQDYISVGLSSQASAGDLLLTHNVTYYVTVVARNGAGLVANVTSEGVTYIATELNVTLLRTLVNVEFTELLVFEDENGEEFAVRRTDRDFRASVSWAGVGSDIQDISWYIGSVAGRDDILPPVNISLVNIDMLTATVDSGTILQGGRPFTNVSEVIALEEGKEQDPADNLLFFEPGRLIYHSIEFCNLVHVCTIAMGTPSIVIRGKDVGFAAIFADSASRLEVRQVVGVGVNRQTLHTLDKEYSLTVETDRGLEVNSRLYAGFLNQEDVTKTYRVLAPYISNPFLTMGLTSREIARRFTEFGGPSFYVSFLGQETLNAPLDINVTFDSSLDWDVATPEIGFWDIDAGVWREVSETCANSSRVDYTTFTIAVRVCSTVLGAATPSPNRPRQRRQTDNNDLNVTTDTSGSGVSDMMDTSVLNFLERPVQFIVMRIGNVSTNSAPELLLPATPLEVTEDTPLTIQLEYTDAEFDTVTFELLSVSKLGNVTLTSSGLLTYDPCQNCVGTDVIQLSIRERPIVENQIPLEDFGEIVVLISNRNDPPHLFFYNSSDSDEIITSEVISVFIDSDRASPAVLASVAALDPDGYRDDLQFDVLQDTEQGSVAFRTRLNAVNVFESLPVTLTFSQPDLSEYHDYITLHSSDVTYLPDSGFTGTDMVAIIVRDSQTVQSEMVLLIMIEVLPSPCQNDGVCGGSEADPTCEDIAQRRTGFDGYNCSCLPGYAGEFCEEELAAPEPPPIRECPLGVPVVQCDGDPCGGAMCPSHPLAECRANFCGSCKAEWYQGDQQITCNADGVSSICDKLIPNAPNDVIVECSMVECPCPAQPYSCPEDSILVENRVDNCCVFYECVCPNISCPLIMEAGEGVQPVPNYRGNQFPGRCCPEYSFEDINECETRSDNICSDVCVDQQGSYSCDCPQGRTLARDQVNCGVCPYNGMEYLLGDRVKIGCNWCLCRGDGLNEERWHCTANSCDSGCLSDGMLHPLGSRITTGNRECICAETDINSQEWMCEG